MSANCRCSEVPFADPRRIIAAQCDHTEPEDIQGLDGNGTIRAADLPNTEHTWGHCSPPTDNDNLDLGKDTLVRHTLCLMLDPDGDRLMPGRCKMPLGHKDDHDWGATHGAFLGKERRAELRDTPSDRLPVRTPGAVLAESAREDEGGTPGHPEAGRPGESNLARRVIGR